MLVVLVLFPIVMLELRFLSPLLGGLNSSVSMFIGNVISVALIAWPFMPLVVGPMNWWLLPKKDSAGWTNPAGIALLGRSLCGGNYDICGSFLRRTRPIQRRPND